MKKSIFIIILIVIVSNEIILGSFFLFRGFTKKEVNNEKMEEMLDFIQKYNPKFYNEIVIEEREDSKEIFYNYFTKKGDKYLALIGMILILIAVNTIVLKSLYLVSSSGVIKLDNNEKEEDIAKIPENEKETQKKDNSKTVVQPKK